MSNPSASKWTIKFTKNLINELKNEPLDTVKVKIGEIKTGEMSSCLKKALKTQVSDEIKELIIEAIEVAKDREIRRKNSSEFGKGAKTWTLKNSKTNY